ncbi:MULTISPECIES: acyl carrier protein [unclassified Bradyrhizobium]|uniref:acyl carrier protein n=1 Tax=unclassified Bradyrhizobium TaxID=2631580 RepID=UPI002916D260|nr:MULTISPECIES: acyl carrier protein [unclassified Bradyrhizobium]
MSHDRDLRQIALVIETLRQVLPHADQPLTGDTPLTAIWTYDSLSLYRMITELESVFNVELDAALIVPDTFATPATIARAFTAQDGKLLSISGKETKR